MSSQFALNLVLCMEYILTDCLPQHSFYFFLSFNCGYALSILEDFPIRSYCTYNKYIKG